MSNSSHSSPSPHMGPATSTKPDEPPLPTGQCRYILSLPEIKGQRCACVSFTHNKALPGATCDCGHFACFHNARLDKSVDNNHVQNILQRMHALETRDKELLESRDRELEQLREKVQELEAQVQQENDREHQILMRVSELEDSVEKKAEEVGNEFKSCYRNLNQAWTSVTELERRNQQYDPHLRHLNAQVHGISVELQRISQRQLEQSDESIALEERLDALEEAAEDPLCAAVMRGRTRRRSISDVTASGTTSTPMKMPLRPASEAHPSALWTVHISLLPKADTMFPFERDTHSYNRCLSRGLHQMVAINGYDAESFVGAVTRAFNSLLRGREWMPLKAVPCTAANLKGLPMLQILSDEKLDEPWDMAFLRENCAVRDTTGKIDHLYIAMRHEHFSWHFLRHSPVWMDGLEASWAYNELLDSQDPNFDDDTDVEDPNRPAAGDMLPAPASLKRSAAEMSRGSFGSATAVPPSSAVAGPSSSAATTTPANDGEGSRKPKVPRLPNICEVRSETRRSRVGAA